MYISNILTINRGIVFQKVVQRKGRKNGGHRFLSECTTFFFRNFPEECKEETLRRKFGEVRKVVDVFIPAKRDRSGKRFGFIRFEGLDGCQDRLDKLNKIWVDSFLIRAFVPRFTRSIAMRREGSCSRDKPASMGSERRGSVGLGSGGGSERERSSVKELVLSPLGGNQGDEEVQRKNMWEQEGERRKGFWSSEEEGSWLRGAFTGRLRDDFLWKFHGEEMQNECIGKLKLVDMGDRLVLIRSESARNTQDELSGFGEWAKNWLEWRRPWRVTDVNQHRLVWTRWLGVPLQAWSHRFFSWGCSKLGRVVEMHEFTESRQKLDAAYVQILTRLSSLEGVLSCKIDGRSFNIRIEEIRGVDKEMRI